MEIGTYYHDLLLFFVKVGALLSVAYIIKEMGSSTIYTRSLKYFGLYFFLVLFAAVVKAVKNYYGMEVSLVGLVFMFVLSTILLFFALDDRMKNKFIFYSFLLSIALFFVSTIFVAYSDYDYLIVHSIFTIFSYSFLSYIVIKKAREFQNSGYNILLLAFSVLVLVSIVELQSLYNNEVVIAYAWARISANTGIILVIIGFLAINLINEYKYLGVLALTDSLTNMNNRRGLDFMLQSIIPSSNRNNMCFSVITIDIDFFKKVNDTYGHDGGDIVLKEFARVIQSTHRNNDISCRFGGEEFVIVLPDANKEKSILMAEKLRKNIEANGISIDGKLLNITASFGIATSCSEINIDELMKDSDKALYIAKCAGRNRVIHIDNDCTNGQ